MSRWQAALKDAMQLQGARGAALVDLETGTCATVAADAEEEEELSLIAQVHARMLRAQMRLAAGGSTQGGRGDRDDHGRNERRTPDRVEDLMITFERNYHLIRPVRAEDGEPETFLCLVMDRSLANLAMTRRKLVELEERVAQGMAMDRRNESSGRTKAEMTENKESVPAFMRDDLVMRLLGLGPAKPIPETTMQR